MLVTHDQKVNSRLTLGHNAYVTCLSFSPHAGIVSSPITARRVSAGQSGEVKEKGTTPTGLLLQRGVTVIPFRY